MIATSCLLELGLDPGTLAEKLRNAAAAHVEGAVRQAAAVESAMERAHLEAKRKGELR